MGQQRTLRRGRSAAAAATAAAGAASAGTPSNSEQQEQDDDANLPAEEAEIEDDDDAASGSGEDEEGAESSESGADGEEDGDQEGGGSGAEDADEESQETGAADEDGSEDEEDGGDEEQQDDAAEAQEEEDEQQDDEAEAEAEAEEAQAAASEQPKPGVKKTPQQAAAAAAAARKKAAAAKAVQLRLAAAGSRAPNRIPMINPAAVLSMTKEEQSKLLSRATALRKTRQLARAAPPVEPKRNKTHWDHLLEEVQWMAKEFQRERAWKLKQAKRFVKAVKSSRLDVESRAEVRAQEEVLSLRRRAAWVAREVGAFWNKAERVVNYKIYVAIESRKREVLDKHLDMIVGQTERFSKMLAQNLIGPAASQQDEVIAMQQQQQQELQALPAPGDAAGGSRRRARRTSSMTGSEQAAVKAEADDNSQQPAPQQQPDVKAEQQPSQQQQQEQQMLAKPEPGSDHAEEEGLEALAGELLPDDGGAAAEEPLGGPGKRRRSSSGAGTAVASDGSNPSAAAAAVEELPDAADAEQQRPSKRARRGLQRSSKPAAGAAGALAKKAVGGAGAAAGGGAGGDADFESAEEASDDDEATLEEEERLAAEDDDTKEGGGDELDALDEEANLPIEELLARYGFMVPDKDADQQHHDSEEDQEEDEDGQEPAADGQHRGKAGVKQEPHDGRQQQEGSPDKAQGGKKAAGSGDEGDDDDAVVAASRDAAAAQPTGFTLATTHVKTPVPFLLKHTLREYQHIGLDWLVSLYEKRINGILADEMGLGKTIQTVALLAHLACEEGVWGPHLVVVPTSVMLNWEMEFKKWCPAFKLLTYYGSAKERKAKRQGWSKPHAFHVCITSYTLALQDAKVFKRKKWRYLILDEAHMIKNWKSQRWQTLLRFNSKRRLLITGTPLQNDLMELWSLMHFLMPAVFASHAQFKDWFSNPLTGAVETGQEVSRQLVERLHGVLRPFLLRRLKAEVEKQMPPKHEHVLTCNLSRRQRQLYDEYMARSETHAVMSGGNFMGVINVLMQLRKVCNHPDLFEGRPIVSAFDMPGLSLQYPSCVMSGIMPSQDDVATSLAGWGLLPGALTGKLAIWEADETANLAAWPSELAEVAAEAACDPAGGAKEAGPLQRAAAAAALAAGLVPQLPPGAAEGRGGLRGASSGSWTKMAAAAADNVRHDHGQLQAASGAAAALTNALLRQWQMHTSWRASRVALAGALSLQRCGLDLLMLPGAGTSLQQQAGTRGYSSGPLVSGDWLPLDACGVPVGAASNGRYPDEAAYTSAAADGSKLVLLLPAAGTSGGGSRKAAAASTAGCRSSSNRLPLCGWDLARAVGGAAHPVAACLRGRTGCMALADLPSLVLEVSPTYVERAAAMEYTLRWFMFAIPRTRAPAIEAWCCKPDGSALRKAAAAAAVAQQEWFKHAGCLRTAFVRRQLFFPDRRLLQYDCGKLVELDVLLRKLKAGGHRVLIFTQMAKMLDLLEAFLNLHGHTYMRLDGATKPEARQIMMQRFNSDPKYFVFILSTRSGGVGINLTGADTVIFYDSDWNPAMDQQAQDRCHRIGQTREVHIYRLISSNTIEENILRKSDQKRQLDWLAIQSGGFNTEMLAKLNLGGGGAAGALSADDLRAALRAAEDEADVAAAATAEKEAEAEMEEFTAEPPPEEIKDEELEGDDGDTRTAGAKAGTPSVSTAAPPPPLPPSGRKGRGRGRQQQAARASSPSAATDTPPGGDKGGGNRDKPGADSTPGAPDAAADGGPDEKAAGGEAEGETAEAQARSMVMKDLAEGQSGQDLLARLSGSLSAVEQYAVRFLESLQPVDVEAAAAAAVEDIKQEEWELDAIEKRKEQQEAEAEDSEEMVDNWDKAEANAAYREYQEQIAALLKHQEQEAAAAAAAAAEEAEFTEAGGLGPEYGYGSYPGSGDFGDADYSTYPEGEGDEAGGEVTSPTGTSIQSARIRAKREAAALGLGMESWQQQQQHHQYHPQLPGGHFHQQQGLQWPQQPFKRQKSIGFGGYAPLDAGLPPAGSSGGGGGRGGRGRGRVGRPPGRGRGAAAGGYGGRGAPAAAAGGYGQPPGGMGYGLGPGPYGGAAAGAAGVKDEYGANSWHHWDDADSTQSQLLAWQLLEEAGSLNSQCWLQPAAAAGADAGAGAATLLMPGSCLLPWELQWDPPLAAALAAAAGSEAESAMAAAAAVAAGSLGADGSGPPQPAAAAQHAVGVRDWLPERWAQVAEALREQLAAPVPRTALNSRITGPACRLRFLQLLDDFVTLQQQQAAADSSSSSSSSAVTGIPAALARKATAVLQGLSPDVQTLLSSVIGVGGPAVSVKLEDAGSSGLLSNGHMPSPAAAAAPAGVQQEYQRLVQQQVTAAGAPGGQQQEQQAPAVVTVALLQQLAAAVEETSSAAAQAAAAAAAAATAACGISTRRQSDSVKAVVGGATTLVIAPSAAQVSSIMDETDGDTLGAGPAVAWGAAYAQAAALATAASGALRQHSLGHTQSSQYGHAAAAGAGGYGRGGRQGAAAAAAAAPPGWDQAAAAGPGPAASDQKLQQRDSGQFNHMPSSAEQHSPDGFNGHGSYYNAPSSAPAAAAPTGRGRGRVGRPPGRGGRGRGRGRAAAAAAVHHAAAAAAPPALHQQQQQLMLPSQFLQQQQQLQQFLQLQQQHQQQQHAPPASSALALSASQAMLLQQQQHQMGAGVMPAAGQQANPAAAASIQQQLLLQQQQLRQMGGLGAAAAAAAAAVGQGAGGALQPNAVAMFLAQQQLQQQLQLQQQGYVLPPASVAMPVASAAAVGSGSRGSTPPAAGMPTTPGAVAVLQQNVAAGFNATIMGGLNPAQLLQMQVQQHQQQPQQQQGAALLQQHLLQHLHQQQMAAAAAAGAGGVPNGAVQPPG